MLTREGLERIEGLWSEPGWPDDIATPFAREKHRQALSYYLARVRHLGLGGGLVVDMGCGSGTWAFALASRFDRVVGLDFASDRIATAHWLRNRFELTDVGFLLGDIRALPIAGGAADAAYCNSVAFGHLPLEVIFAEAFRILRPGGVFYIGLNGLGYAYSLLEAQDDTRRAKGQWTIYHTLCETRLAPLIERLSPGNWRGATVRTGLKVTGSPSRFLMLIGAARAQIAAARTIESDLGPEFADVLARDLRGIARGTRDAFSNANNGRGYDPQELAEIAAGTGFSRLEWAHDGCLSLAPDASIAKAALPEAPGSAGEFKGRLRMFEALMWKPAIDATGG